MQSAQWTNTIKALKKHMGTLGWFEQVSNSAINLTKKEEGKVDVEN